MKQLTATLALSTFLAGAAWTPCAWCTDDVSVSGVVRDVHGTPLLGMLVQLFGQHAMVLAQTFTDDHGRYSLRAGLPGEYELRASGTFLLPATLPHLRLQTGTRAAADFTMLALFEAGTLLPAEKRTASDTSDDWRWTLRSIANRPLLRLVGAPAGEDGADEARPNAGLHGQLALNTGNAQFASSGTRQTFAVYRNESEDVTSMFRADLDGAVVPAQTEAYGLTAGLQKDASCRVGSRIVVNVSAYPNLLTGHGSGVQVMRAATAERLTIGDEVTVDAGTLLTIEHMARGAFESAPYVRISFHPSAQLRVEYHMATDKTLQRSEDLDEGSLREEMLTDGLGNAILHRGLHQELLAVKSYPRRDVSLAVFRDSVPFEAIQGQGSLHIKETSSLPLIVDAESDTLRVAVRGYTAAGAGLALSEAITPMLVARLDGQVGTALVGDGTPLRLVSLQSQLHPRKTAALSGALSVHSDRTGTVLRVHYRWQSASTLTQVDEFENSPAQAFLGFDVRQRLCRGRRFAHVDAVVDANNVLSQGYELALGPERQTIQLMQEPRSIQGGLAFSF